MRTRLLSLIPFLLLAACSGAPAVATPAVVEQPAQDTVRAAAVVETVQSAVAAVGVPAGNVLRDAVQATVPLPESADKPPLVSPAAVAPSLSPAGVDHIIRWEIGSRARYDKLYQAPIWPRGASGITWCIGYDGGHQSKKTILRDWSTHPQVGRLAETAGITGNAARDALPRFRDIKTDFDPCLDVFVDTSVPVYMRTATRAYGDALLTQPQGVIDAIFGNTYNRGGSMVGSRNAEKRHIRDVCLPAADLRCIATQLRASCRLWVGTPLEDGLCGRRESEAQLAEGVR